MRRVPGILLSLILLIFVTATTAQAGFLYVLRNDAGGNQIYGYSINEASGAAALLPGFPLSTGGTGGGLFGNGHVTIDKRNRRLYVINDGTDNVSAYAIDPASGTLTPLPFSPMELDGSAGWIRASVHPSGSPLLIGNFQGKLYSYSMTATTATLVQGPISLGTAPESSVFGRDANFFFTGGIQFILGFSVNPSSGIISPLSGSPYTVNGGPVGYSMDAQDRLFLVEYANARLRVFQSTNGELTPAAGNPFGNGLSQCVDSVLHPNGNYYFIAGRDLSQVGSYLISGTGTSTTLSNVNGSPFSTGGTSPNVIEINHNGKFLYVANAVSRNLTTFSVEASNGNLVNIDLQPANTLGASGFITGMEYIPLVSVSGRVVTASGRGVSGAIVSITDTSNYTRVARTNGSGYFRVPGVLAGETYTLTVKHKRNIFAQQSITVSDKLGDLLLTAEQ